jgi:aspartate kinase
MLGQEGGSNLTATALGASLLLYEIQVWKDVDGFLSSYPRMLANGGPLDQVVLKRQVNWRTLGRECCIQLPCNWT